MQHTRSRMAHGPQHTPDGEMAGGVRALPVMLRAVGVAKSYRYGVAGCGGSVRALVGASLHVARGETVGVNGATGAGKSTLLLCCAGLMRPDTGRVESAGGIMGRPPSYGVAFVPQCPSFSSFLTVREVIDRYARTRSAAGRVLATLDGATLLGIAGHRVGTVGGLSIGARWRLALVAAMLAQPLLLVADGMDCEVSPLHLEASAKLLHLFCERGGAVLVSVRDRLALEGVANRVLTIRNGHLEERRSLRRAPARATHANGFVVDSVPIAASGSVDRVVAAI